MNLIKAHYTPLASFSRWLIWLNCQLKHWFRCSTVVTSTFDASVMQIKHMHIQHKVHISLFPALCLPDWQVGDADTSYSCFQIQSDKTKRKAEGARAEKQGTMQSNEMVEETEQNWNCSYNGTSHPCLMLHLILRNSEWKVCLQLFG